MAPKNNIAQRVKSLRVGEQVSFPIEKANYVRNLCSQLGMITGVILTTSQHREDRTVTVTRRRRQAIDNNNC